MIRTAKSDVCGAALRRFRIDERRASATPRRAVLVLRRAGPACCCSEVSALRPKLPCGFRPAGAWKTKTTRAAAMREVAEETRLVDVVPGPEVVVCRAGGGLRAGRRGDDRRGEGRLTALGE